ncbi:GMC oxidoreductase [Hypoxylon trugodes]|uniref:GMC oxidoreductase n=1 Tax=Hypoxylon trugodes TaxID=326681 RepID=UPI00219ECB86|nr:GMC oxidoreductase [Hypoxylon trugodes]KAI1386571.1 GMC oxidoreductase [Hypoxylon trugodes]
MAFDYIVAGGGTAGLVIANRLSENPSITVAVVEPGKDVRDDAGVLDVDLAGVTYSPTLDWNFKSTVQSQLGNRAIDHHAGKALGGTTVINGMYYIRGDRDNYDAWEHLGNPGWNWNALLPYFIRSEKFAVPTDAQIKAGMSYIPRYHGEEGLLKTGHPYQVENGSFHRSAKETCESLGFALNQDMNSGETRGFGAYPQTLDRDANVRESAARAYYEPIDSRPNLHVIQGTVKRITLSSSASGELVATGVEYTDDNDNLASVTAKKEVILSAGTYVSPLILEASGIGNPNVLARNNIQTKLDLPGVGEGFQDQPLWVLMFQASTKLTGHVPFAAFATAQDIFGADTDAVAAATKEKIASWSEAIAKRLNGGVSANALEKRFRVQHDVIFDKQASMTEFEFFSLGNVTGIVFSPTLPFSWGSVHLDGTGQTDSPAIDPNFLSIDFDTQTALKVGRIARRMWSTKPLSELAGDLTVPGDTVLPENATDAEWTEFLTSSCVPAFHCIGTCAMLPRELGGVVDPTLKVYGTTNVRVVDASVIPHLMSGHPSAAVYALAERAADLIKESLSVGSQDESR